MKLTKRILASVLATVCAVSSFSLASLAADDTATGSEMQLGLNATFYQTKGRNQQGEALINAVAEELGWGYHVDSGTTHNHGNGDAIADEDKLFDETIEAYKNNTVEVESDLTGYDIAGLASISDDSYWAHLTGDIEIEEAEIYQFRGRIDNSLVIELTPKTDGAEPIRVFEFWAKGDWADAGDGVVDNAVPLEAGEYTIDAYYFEAWGGNLSEVKVKKGEDGNFEPFDDTYVIDNTSTDVYTMYGFTGDYDQITAKIPTVGGEQSANFDETKKQYDATIADVMSVLVEAGTTVVPTPTFESNLQGYAEAAGCSGNDAILADLNGYITAKESGTYQFGLLKVDNGAVVTIGEDDPATEEVDESKRVIEYWAKGAFVNNITEAFYDETAPTVDLVAGEPVKINVKYLELDGSEKLHIYARKVTSTPAEEEGAEPTVTYGDGALVDDSFIFTQTNVVDVDSAIATQLPPTLESPNTGDEVIFQGFVDLPEGSENNGVVIDEETGIATFNGKETNIVLPESITAQINASKKLIVEAIIKPEDTPTDHGVLASVGTSTNENSDVQTALMGLRQGWAVKAIGANDACPKNVLSYKTWATVKWVFDKNGTKIYVDGNEVVNVNTVVQLDKIAGQFKINTPSVNEWPDPGLTGQMADFRITIDDLDCAGVDSIEVDGVKATALPNNAYAVTVNAAKTHDVKVNTTNDNATYTWDAKTGKIIVTAVDGITTANYTLKITEKATVVTPPKTVAVSKVSLNKTKATLVAGKSVTLRATVTPSNATNKKVTWKSSNTKVATVNASGKVTAKGVGTAKITATAGGKTATCTVTVKPGAVTKLKVTSPKKKTLKITFKKGAKASATKLVIYRGKKKVKTVNTSKTSVTVKNLKAGSYTVQASATKKVSKKTYTSSVVKNKKAVKVK